MLNLTSSGNQILEELYGEIDKAYYWRDKFFSKKTVGKKAMESYARCHEKAPESLITGINVEYEAPSGNKWLLTDLIIPDDKKEFGFNIKLMAFIYYETASSIGCFVPTNDCVDGQSKKAVNVFTDHFFQRYSERVGVEFKSKEMITSFIIRLANCSYIWITDKHGRHPVFRIPRLGVSMVVPKKDNPLVFEHRTFLSDENLYPKQLNEFKDVIKRGDRFAKEKINLKPNVLETVTIEY